MRSGGRGSGNDSLMEVMKRSPPAARRLAGSHVTAQPRPLTVRKSDLETQSVVFPSTKPCFQPMISHRSELPVRLFLGGRGLTDPRTNTTLAGLGETESRL